MKKKTIILAGILGAFCMLGAGCGQMTKMLDLDRVMNDVAGNVAESEIEAACGDSAEENTVCENGDGMTAEETTETFQEIIETVEIVAVGDNLIHEGLYKTGMNDSGE